MLSWISSNDRNLFCHRCGGCIGRVESSRKVQQTIPWLAEASLGYLLPHDVVTWFSVPPSSLPICLSLLRTHTTLEWFNLKQLSLCWEEHAKISSFHIQLSLQQGQHPAIYFQSVMIALQSSQKAMTGLILEAVLMDFFHCTQCKGRPLKLCKSQIWIYF